MVDVVHAGKKNRVISGLEKIADWMQRTVCNNLVGVDEFGERVGFNRLGKERCRVRGESIVMVDKADPSSIGCCNSSIRRRRDTSILGVAKDDDIGFESMRVEPSFCFRRRRTVVA